MLNKLAQTSGTAVTVCAAHGPVAHNWLAAKGVRPQKGSGTFLERYFFLVTNWREEQRGELEDASGCGWDLKRVQQTVLKAEARVVKHGRRLIVDVARAAGVLWDRLLDRVWCWWRDEACGCAGPRPRRRVPPPRHAHLGLVLRE